MKVSNTHFEQIPVETVKKIAQELPENEAIENDDVSTDTQGLFHARIPKIPHMLETLTQYPEQGW